MTWWLRVVIAHTDFISTKPLLCRPTLFVFTREILLIKRLEFVGSFNPAGD